VSALDQGRAIAWGELDASGLSPEKRAVVAATWKERARQEHLAVGAFSLVAQELAAVGADAIVLALATKAAWDEVRHTDICRRMAIALGADVPSGWRGVPKVPTHGDADVATRTLLHVVEMCCLSETLTGVYFTEMHRRATNAVARAVVASLLEDELDHGRLGWAYLAARRRDGTLAGLEGALPAMIDRTIGRAKTPREGGEDDPAMEAFGFLGKRASRETLDHAMDEVIAPGFAELGVRV
jgi:hypothetical protein